MTESPTPEDEQRKPEPRTFLLDLGYTDAESFCKNLLNTSEFPQVILQRFVPKGHKSDPKEDMAREVTGRLLARSVNAETLVLEYCKQAKKQLCVRFIKGIIQPNQSGTAFEFLTKRAKGEETAWYGPFGTGEERWYVATQNVPHFIHSENSKPTKCFFRWQVVAQITNQYVALHWNNFYHKGNDTNDSQNQHPYWKQIPGLFRNLEKLLNIEIDREHPNLADIILHGSLDRYSDNPEYSWQHKRVRASYQAVAVNANSGVKSVNDLDPDEQAATGLQILTTALAKTALTALDMDHDKAALSKVERALLRHILHDWGTKSYEFILTPKSSDAPRADVRDSLEDLDDTPVEETDTLRQRMHVYFGSDSPAVGDPVSQDGLEHIACFAGRGGSSSALQFVLAEHAKEEEENDVKQDYDTKAEDFG